MLVPRRRGGLVLSVGLLLCASTTWSIIRRHDVPDEQYVVDASEYPAIVDLFIDQPGDCLATLIAPRWLITAAHCAEDSRQSDSIRVGGAVYSIELIDTHAGWNQDTDDITLLRLDAEVPDVTPLGWYTGADEVGKVVWFVGRGDTSTGDVGGGSPDGKTRAATNTVVGADAYWLRFVFNAPGEPEITPLEGISGDGDSGGPALVETPGGLQVMGISSFQEEGNRPIGTYGVEEYYTRVSRYAAWIAARVETSPPGSQSDGGAGAADAGTASNDDGGASPDAGVGPGDTGGTGDAAGCSAAGGAGHRRALALALLLALAWRRCRGRER